MERAPCAEPSAISASSSARSSTLACPRRIFSSSSLSRRCISLSCLSLSAIFSASCRLIASSSDSRYDRLRQFITYCAYCALSSDSSCSYSSMKAGRTVWSDCSRFWWRSSSVFFLSIFCCRLASSCERLPSMRSICSACTAASSTILLICFCMLATSWFLPRAFAVRSLVSACLPSSSKRREPNFVMSAETARVILMSANLCPGPRSNEMLSCVSSPSAPALRCASFKSAATLSSSRTAKPFA
mmetsp:Transcript_58954/g.135195  ORF Transcript_58954/g.135195 Transcript_58954/m.135195 type:complete len:244 (-) Transcript_58954:315-1046(-)